jgi:hypothetical protein
MTSNMTFTGPNYKGQQTVNGIPLKFADGFVTVGGIFSKDAVNSGLHAYFGYMVSSLPTPDTDFFLGLPSSKSTAIVSGIIVADQNMLEAAPAKPEYYLDNTPITVLKRGVVSYRSWETVTGSIIAPVFGAVVLFNNTTGQIAFAASGTTTLSGYTVTTAKIVHVDAETGSVFVSFNFI